MQQVRSSHNGHRDDASGAPAAAGFVAVLAGVGLSLAIGILAPRQSTMHRMFDWHRVESVIPALILSMFFWGMLICWFRRQRLSAMRTASPPNEVHQTIRAIHENGIASVLETLATRAPQQSPLLRRVRAVIEQWMAAPQLQDADVILQQHAEQDQEALQGGYALVRVFIWALPVLGLIGTVIGISLAVGGFATFLAGSIEDVALIKSNLVDVTGGLSFAFLITLQGLATSLVLMFWASSLQNAENALLMRVQRQLTDELLPALQAAAPAQLKSETQTQAPGPSPELARAILATVKELADQLLRGIDHRMQQQEQRVATSMGDYAKQLQTSALQFNQSIAQCAQFVAKTFEKLTAETASLQGGVAQQRQQFVEMLQAHQATVTKAQGQVVEAFIKQNEAVAANAASLRDVAAATRDIHEVKLGEALSSVSASLNSVLPVLKAFQRPFALHMTPIEREINESAASTVNVAVDRVIAAAASG